MIHIIDYGMGNFGSIGNMLKYIGCKSEVTSDIEKIGSAKKLILPGVGAFDNGMTKIRELRLKSILDKMALEEKIPILGICLGMQLMTGKSEEGSSRGLGWFDAETIKFDFGRRRIKIPHMGWNNVSVRNSNPLFKNMSTEPRFYFVHSYYVKCNKSENVIGETEYGRKFASIICKKNIFGCQFHPEKSHKFGMHLLRNFAEL